MTLSAMGAGGTGYSALITSTTDAGEIFILRIYAMSEYISLNAVCLQNGIVPVIRTSFYSNVHKCMIAYVHTCVYIYIHASIHTHIQIYIPTYVHICQHTCIYTHTRVRTYVHT